MRYITTVFRCCKRGKLPRIAWIADVINGESAGLTSCEGVVSPHLDEIKILVLIIPVTNQLRIRQIAHVVGIEALIWMSHVQAVSIQSKTASR